MNLEHLNTELEWMATWRDVLEWKINSPQRQFEPAHLEAELKSWRRECRALAQEYKRRAWTTPNSMPK